MQDLVCQEKESLSTRGQRKMCGAFWSKLSATRLNRQGPTGMQHLKILLLQKLWLPGSHPIVCTSSGAFGNPGGPATADCQKTNENWQLYLIMQPSAMCLQQTPFFLWRVIILSVPI